MREGHDGVSRLNSEQFYTVAEKIDKIKEDSGGKTADVWKLVNEWSGSM